ncbi:unnamed protein product [Amoebophrya sp. A120]|nr:unnamed protein product [Amoebophrya sp. A120]|eukprot:GSA120T00015004001.1
MSFIAFAGGMVGGGHRCICHFRGDLHLSEQRRNKTKTRGREIQRRVACALCQLEQIACIHLEPPVPRSALIKLQLKHFASETICRREFCFTSGTTSSHGMVFPAANEQGRVSS